jgi:hypothetical protein
MTFEGEHKIIPIKGIARVGADTMCEDGAMNEVIGLEYKDGSYVPYAGELDELLTLPQGTEFFRLHKTSSGNNIIAYFQDDNGNFSLAWMREKNFNEGKGKFSESWIRIIEHDVNIIDVKNVKNILIIERENKEIIYARFTGSKYEEIKIKDMADNLPILNLYVTNDINIKINNKSNGPILCVKDSGQTLGFDAINRAYNEGLAKLNELGRLHGYVLAVYAYKLVSGEYVYASAPVLLCPPNNAVGKTTSYQNKYNKKYYYATQFLGTYGDNKLLTYCAESVMDEAFEHGNVASMDKWARHFAANNNGTAQYLGDADVPKSIDNMPPLWGGILFSAASGSSSTWRHTFLAMASNSLMCKINSSIQQEYKGLIDSCCIFMSEQVPLYEMLKDNVHEGTVMYPVNFSGTQMNATRIYGYNFDKRNEADIKKDIKKINNFYLVHEIKFNELQEGTIEVDLGGKLGDSLPLQETLPISAFNNSIVFNGKSFIYNSRNHLYSYKEKKIYGCKLETSKLVGGNGQLSYSISEGTYKVIAHIKSATDGDYTVVSDDIKLDNKSFNGYFIYPDSSADEVYLLDVNTNMACKFIMTPAKHGGYAYCLVELDQLNFAKYAKEEMGEYNSENVLVDRSNRIKVSDAYFVYTFPLANTSVIGNGDIVGLASLSISMDNDSFGSYPLLVFTTEGIYSMEVDKTGDGAYSNVPPPFSREVCINPNTICEIDGAVLFASSKGLMIATAQGVQEFVPKLNGKPNHLPEDDKATKGLGLVLYKQAINHEQIVKLTECISNNNFIDFLSDSKTVVTYASEKNKIVVYNPSKPYCYWIDIPTRNVTKLPVGIKMDNNNYPNEQYVTREDTLIEFKNLSSEGDVQCMLQSRPIKVDGKMKSYVRLVARGYFNSLSNDKYAVMLVLGSYDGINWQPLGIKQKMFSGGFHDLGCVLDRVSCEYIMVIISGSLTPDSHIDGIELTKTNKYNNKLR